MKLTAPLADVLTLFALSFAISGCGGNVASPPPLSPPPPASSIIVSISPHSVSNLPAEGTQAFTATITGSTNQTVAWSISEGATCGSISSTGDYFAPNSPGIVCHVVATSQADTKKSDAATIALSPISMYILPYQFSLGVGQSLTFAATVEGTADTSVIYSVREGSAGGSITAQGVYTAPQTLGTFHVIATSQADTRFSGVAEVDVVPITVSVLPAADTLGPKGVRAFAATVLGTNQSVIWSIQEGTSGGLITSGGVYTAPINQGVFHVVATSAAENTATGTATVTAVSSGFISTSSMQHQRVLHSSTLLANKNVLLAGGGDNSGCNSGSAELYDSASDSFTQTANMSAARAAHSATLLGSGKVLLAGGTTCDFPVWIDLFASGNVLATAELYDPAAGSFSVTGAMGSARQSHSATLLPNGKVLIAGGTDNSGVTLSSAELYDPSSGTFSRTGSMQKSRVGHSATLLANGKVLIAGGYVPACPGCITIPDNAAEIYDPSTGQFASAGNMLGFRARHTATLLANGKVLLAGGDPTGANGGGAGCTDCIDETDQAELYDPSTGTFGQTGNLAVSRASHTATLLTDGKVLIAGGIGGNLFTEDEFVTFAAEVYDPASGTFASTGGLGSARFAHTATLLASGSVLVTGGLDPKGSALAGAEIYK